MTPANPPDPYRALERIHTLVRATPVISDARLNAELGMELHFKCEHLQETGSFKLRGASHAVSRLPSDCPGVATHSSGNHGAALARAAARQGLAAHVVMPENAVRTKVEAVRAQGGEVHFCTPTQADREAGLAQLVEQGLIPIPPYDHDDVIAGQGTCAVELLTQVPGLEMIVAPIGGGGLISGTALAARGHGRPVRVIGAEPAGADDTWRSLHHGARVRDHHPDTMADGLRALVGERTLPIIRSHVEVVIRVSEAGIVEAMRWIYGQLKQVVEPSGAVALAAILADPDRFAGRRVGVILSGGNLDVDALLAPLRNAVSPPGCDRVGSAETDSPD